MQDADNTMRDLAPQISAAYRRVDQTVSHMQTADMAEQAARQLERQQGFVTAGRIARAEQLGMQASERGEAMIQLLREQIAREIDPELKDRAALFQ
jgi:hypothetical protein